MKTLITTLALTAALGSAALAKPALPATAPRTTAQVTAATQRTAPAAVVAANRRNASLAKRTGYERQSNDDALGRLNAQLRQLSAAH